MGESPQVRESFATDLICFVIGPIGDKHAPIGTDARRIFEDAAELWEFVLEPACDEFGIKPIRADKIAEPGEIPEQVFRLLRDADVVIADVTGGNPNVMYELGLRHTREKPTIQLGEVERLPFDINVVRTIKFRRTDAGLVEARKELARMLTSCLKGQYQPLTATRVWTSLDKPDASTSALPTKEDDEEEALGLIDTLARGEEAMENLAPTLEKATAVIEEIGRYSETAAAAIARSDAAGKGFKGRLVAVRGLASNLEGPSQELENLAADYAEMLLRADPAILLIIKSVEEDPSTYDQAEGLLDALLEMIQTARDSSGSARLLAAVFGDTSNTSKDLRQPARRIERALGKFADGSKILDQWEAGISQLRTKRQSERQASNN